MIKPRAWLEEAEGVRPYVTLDEARAAVYVADEAFTVTPLVPAPPEGAPTYAVEPCTTCGGLPHPSGLPCVCGGANTIHAEVQGLREAALDAHVRLGWYPNIPPRDGSPTYTDLVEVMGDLLGELGRDEMYIPAADRARALLSRIPKEAAK